MAVDLRGSIRLQNAFTPQLESIANTIRTVTDSARNLKPAVERAFNGKKAVEMGNETKKLRDSIERIKPPTQQNRNEQRKHNEELKDGARQASGLAGTLRNVLGIYALIRGVKAFASTADDVMTITARMGMMNDGLQTTAELNRMVFESAQRSRGAYLDTANAVASLGQQTGDLFESNKELVQFSEVLNKQFAIAKTPMESQRSAMLQLTQALGSGVLRGDEFNSIFEAAPQLIGLIAKELNVPVGMMRTMAADGEISADVVKRAFLNAVDETNKAFESMPKTMGQMVQGFKNEAVMAMLPAMQQWNKILNSPAVQGIFNAAIAGVKRFGDALLLVGIVLEHFINWAADNWWWLGGIMTAVGFAVGAVMVQAMIKSALAAIPAIAAWVVLHSKTLLVGAAIGLVIWALGQMGITFTDIVGFIAGLIAVLGALLYNLGVGIVNGSMWAAESVVHAVKLIGYQFNLGVWNIRRGWRSMVNFLKRTFANFGNGVIKMWTGVVNKIIGGFNWLVDKANALPSVMRGGMTFNRINEVQANLIEVPSDDDVDEPPPRPEPPSRPEFPRADYIDLGDAYRSGSDFGKGVIGAIGDRVKDVKDKLDSAMDIDIEGIGGPEGTGNVVELDPDTGKALKGTAKNTKSIDDQLKRTNSDLEVLKDIMTARAITNISWEKLDVHVENSFGDVHQTADLDGWLGSLQEGLQEAVDSAMTGVTVLE